MICELHMIKDIENLLCLDVCTMYMFIYVGYDNHYLPLKHKYTKACTYAYAATKYNTVFNIR